MQVNAGHDLNLRNTPLLAREVPEIVEASIGHALIADALYLGLAGDRAALRAGVPRRGGRRARDAVIVLRALVVVPLAGCFLFPRKSSCPMDRVVVLATQDDVAAFAGCKRAVGLSIRTGAAIDVSPLGELDEITGDLAIGPTVGVESITLRVRRVGGSVRATGNTSLFGLFLPLLEHAGRIDVDANARLATLSARRLAGVTESIIITDNRALALVDLPALVVVGNELVISGDPALELVDMPRLARASAVRLDGDPKLAPAVIDRLRRAAPP